MDKKWIISHKHTSKKRWDMMILLLATMNTFFVPLNIAFKPPRFQGTAFKVFDVFVDILFLVDIVLMFMTSYVNSYGQQVTDQAEIAINYIT